MPVYRHATHYILSVSTRLSASAVRVSDCVRCLGGCIDFLAQQTKHADVLVIQAVVQLADALLKAAASGSAPLADGALVRLLAQRLRTIEDRMPALLHGAQREPTSKQCIQAAAMTRLRQLKQRQTGSGSDSDSDSDAGYDHSDWAALASLSPSRELFLTPSDDALDFCAACSVLQDCCSNACDRELVEEFVASAGRLFCSCRLAGQWAPLSAEGEIAIAIESRMAVMEYWGEASKEMRRNEENKNKHKLTTEETSSQKRKRVG